MRLLKSPPCIERGAQQGGRGAARPPKKKTVFYSVLQRFFRNKDFV